MQSNHGAALRSVFGFDLTAHLVDDALNDGQSESGAAWFGAGVGLEYPRQDFGVEAGTVVGDFQRQPAVVPLCPDFRMDAHKRRAVRMGLSRVLDQVVEYLLELTRVADRTGLGMLEVDLESNPGISRRPQIDDAADQRLQFQGLALASSGPCVVAESIDQPSETVDLVDDGAGCAFHQPCTGRVAVRVAIVAQPH